MDFEVFPDGFTDGFPVRAFFMDDANNEFFLIEAKPEASADVARVLERQLTRYGFDVTTTGERLASYLAVENTYLSTFQMLGGLGLLLGTFGLATVLLPVTTTLASSATTQTAASTAHLAPVAK